MYKASITAFHSLDFPHYDFLVVLAVSVATQATIKILIDWLIDWLIWNIDTLDKNPPSYVENFKDTYRISRISRKM